MNIVEKCFDSSCSSVSVQRFRDGRIEIYPENGSSLFFCPFDRVDYKHQKAKTSTRKVFDYLYIDGDKSKAIKINTYVIPTPFPKEGYGEKFPEFTKSYTKGEPIFRIGPVGLSKITLTIEGTFEFQDEIYEMFGVSVPSVSDITEWPVKYHHTTECNANNGKTVVSVFPLQYYDGFISQKLKDDVSFPDEAAVATCDVFLVDNNAQFIPETPENNAYEDFVEWVVDFEKNTPYSGVITENNFHHFNIYGKWKVKPDKKEILLSYNTTVRMDSNSTDYNNGFYPNVFNGKEKIVSFTQITDKYQMSLPNWITGGAVYRTYDTKSLPPTIFEEWDFYKNIDNKMFIGGIGTYNLIGSKPQRIITLGLLYNDINNNPLKTEYIDKTSGLFKYKNYFIYIANSKVSIVPARMDSSRNYGYFVGNNEYVASFYDNRAFMTPRLITTSADNGVIGYDKSGNKVYGKKSFITTNTPLIVKIRDYEVEDDGMEQYLPLVLFTLSHRNGGGFLRIAKK